MNVRMIKLANDSVPIRNMELYNQPNKKIRLSTPENYEADAMDDLWNDDDITADEFDLATQAYQNIGMGNQSSNFASGNTHAAEERVTVVNETTDSTIVQSEELIQQQYAMEGRMKILSESVEMLKRELSHEKTNRDKTISEKIQQYEEREKQLQREILKIESVLQFKNLEMKTVYEKVHALESQNQEKPSDSNKNSSKLPKKSKSENVAVHSEHVTVNKEVSDPHWGWRLSIEHPLGEISRNDTFTSLLCNRLSPISHSEVSSPRTHLLSDTEIKHQMTVMSLVRSDPKKQICELLDHCTDKLSCYVKYLENCANLNSDVSKSSIAIIKCENNYNQETVISTLKDLVYVTSHCEFKSAVCDWELDIYDNLLEIRRAETENEASTSDICFNKSLCLLNMLFNLANPDAYHCNLHSEESECSLSVLVSWSLSHPDSLKFSTEKLQVQTVLISSNSTTCLCLGLTFLKNMCIYPEFIPALMHQSSMRQKNASCILCSLAVLLYHKISKTPIEYSSTMSIVLDLISSIFSIHDYTDLKLDSSPCISKMLQSIVVSLLKFSKLQNYTVDTIQILQKGFLLLHFLTLYVPNFKEIRANVEDQYINLVCGMLALSREEAIFKDFYDLVHNLWDFQEDASELDMDDPSDDSLQSQ